MLRICCSKGCEAKRSEGGTGVTRGTRGTQTPGGPCCPFPRTPDTDRGVWTCRAEGLWMFLDVFFSSEGLTSRGEGKAREACLGLGWP